MAVFFCYHCYREQEMRFADRKAVVPVRGERILVRITAPHCAVCGNPMITPASEETILQAAYREYRRRHEELD